jgi:hypothetical protein
MENTSVSVMMDFIIWWQQLHRYVLASLLPRRLGENSRITLRDIKRG